MFEPSTDVPCVRIAVRPMDDAAFIVPFVFPVKIDAVSRFEIGNARRQIDVVRNQQRLPRGQLDNEALVTGATGVVDQNFDYGSAAFNLNTALVVGIGLFDGAAKRGGDKKEES